MKIKAHVSILSVILVIGILFTGCTNYAGTVKDDVKDSKRTYNCDYHTFSLNTCISFEMDGETYKITGNIFRIVTDPLQLKDSKGNVVGYASDDYHVVSQDDHAIIIDGKFEVAIEGNFEILGNSYDIYGDDDVKLGKAEFNELCTSGAILDNEGHAVAIYSKSLLLNDYTVDIYDNDICSDKAMLMIIASYVSDYHADNNKND